MTDKDRLQLNLRFDGRRDLLESIKEAAEEADISLNEFVIRSLRASLVNPSIVIPQSNKGQRSPRVLDKPLTILLQVIGDRLTKIEEQLEGVISSRSNTLK